jgi:hypothetical protein
VPTTTNSDKPKTKIDNIKILSDGWTAWPHEFNRLMLKYQISHSFYVTLLYLWSATVGNSKDDAYGTLALTQIPARRKHVQKWIAALCQHGSCFFLEHKASRGSQEGSLFTYREHTTLSDWEKLFEVLAQIELLGGLDDNFTVKKFGQLVASNFDSENESAAQTEDIPPLDDATKRKATAALEAFESATRRKRS